MTLNNSKKIILVDSDLEIQNLISSYFSQMGALVICFNTPEEAILEAKLSGDMWDVILSDLHFSKMTSIDFTVKIKKIFPHLPIILIAHPDASESAVVTIQNGAYDFITKPIQIHQLKIAVERALQIKTLSIDIVELKKKITSNSSDGLIIGRSPGFLAALDIAKRVSTSSANILIYGESGTGKEVFAKYIHNGSLRKEGHFNAINCSAIPENLLESELFGHAKGSFTGAQEKRIGLFEEAEDGTLFLDEIGDLSLPLQAKLLRVLQEKKIKRVGENVYRSVNCRIICATNKNLNLEVRENRFREDLFFRLNVIPITVPPLRERKEDILPLAKHFIKKYSLENNVIAKLISKEAIVFLISNVWRGNVRELENTIERAVVLSEHEEISLKDLMPFNAGLSDSKTDVQDVNVFRFSYGEELPTLNDMFRKYIEYAIQINGGARDKTAKKLGIDRKTLYKWLKPSAEDVPGVEHIQ